MDSKGYYRKYDVRMADGTEIKDREFFCLDLTYDTAARRAAKYYAVITQNIRLLNDLNSTFPTEGI